ncbi:MAG TPA: protoporphyrinogen oxidase [Solirubrobacteraceae bacterium]|nr:protoporphyrinogen oxidase [Solirubrobacteraceae bacterium]
MSEPEVPTAMSERPLVAIVGGGIAGLAAADRLDGMHRAAGGASSAGPRIVLLEASERIGGNIRTEEFAGRPLDVGAEALLARVPGALELCHDLGLEHDLVAPAEDQPYVWTDRLRPLPPRLMSGVPNGSQALIGSGILSSLGLARAGLDLIVPAHRPTRDASIGALVRGRLGDQVLERLIDPLLGGIHAGSCDELSVRAAAPQLEAALRKRRSLVRGLRALAGASSPQAPTGPTFLTLSGGLEELVRTLHERRACVECRTQSAPRSLSPLPAGGARLTLADGESLDADHVILAVPAFAAAAILAEACPAAAGELEGISYASVATIALSYPTEAFDGKPTGSGFLVQRNRGRMITACTWSSAKWPHLTGDTVLLKCSAGHAADRAALDLDDERLISATCADLAQAMGLHAAPLEAKVFRFERALPQYTVGHLERIARIDAALAPLPGVSLCGAAYRGVGVAACIRDGQTAADGVLAELGRSEEIGQRSAAADRTAA